MLRVMLEAVFNWCYDQLLEEATITFSPLFYRSTDTSTRTHARTQLLTHPFTNSLTHPSTLSFTHSLTFMHLFLNLFMVIKKLNTFINLHSTQTLESNTHIMHSDTQPLVYVLHINCKTRCYIALMTKLVY